MSEQVPLFADHPTPVVYAVSHVVKVGEVRLVYQRVETNPPTWKVRFSTLMADEPKNLLPDTWRNCKHIKEQIPTEAAANKFALHCATRLWQYIELRRQTDKTLAETLTNIIQFGNV